jgi:hypothetical protein
MDGIAKGISGSTGFTGNADLTPLEAAKTAQWRVFQGLLGQVSGSDVRTIQAWSVYKLMSRQGIPGGRTRYIGGSGSGLA